VIIVDVNLLLYAVISGFPQHEAARAWWDKTLSDAFEIGLASPSLFGFLRIATNPRVLERPLSVVQAAEYVSEWMARPNVTFVVPGAGHLEVALGLLREVGTAGNFTTDVQLAALALERDAELCSNDTDFGRFGGLRWTNPLAH
jgi:toxin-antitoxin system PIN domain toxin